MMHMKVGSRLAAGFGLVVVLMMGITWLGITRLGALDDSTGLIVNDRYPKVVLANAVLSDISETAILMRNMLILDDPEKIKSELASLLEIRRKVNDNLDKLDKSLSTQQGRQIYVDIVKARAKYAVAQAQFLNYLAEGKKQEASRSLQATLIQDQRAYIDDVKALVGLIGTLMDQSGEQAASNFRSGSNLMLALAALATLLACALAYWTTRSITVPLTRAVKVARTVASGDLTSHIESTGNDETGQLLQALKDMNDSLVRIVGQVRSGTDTIATASCQIAAGNLDLSSRTEEQASSLEETASSMEELTATVKQNADHARQANLLAASASQVALKGGTMVAQVVGTMASINESSKKIVDIISVIDGIAFQTNILALNAAVEAARAGEQGRGFAVVATEVRNLAHRSAAAAKEIKVLIGDSVAQVETGSKLVNQAGSTMHDIVDSVRRVSDVMSEIIAASEEQSADLAQINQAISQMDQVTQQNAALVEQAAAAAESLHEQAGHLTQVVGVFRIDTLHAAPLAVAALAAPTERTPFCIPARVKTTPKAAPPRVPALASSGTAAAVIGAGVWEEF